MFFFLANQRAGVIVGNRTAIIQAITLAGNHQVLLVPVLQDPSNVYVVTM